MNATARMAELLAHLRREMNGAVVGAMQERGIRYPLSYGVSVPAIRALAAPYGPDNTLARLLIRQQVRELQLASFVVADPLRLEPDDVALWGGRIVNSELSEHAAVMMARSPLALHSARAWLASPELPLQYAALLTAARCPSPGEAFSPSELSEWVATAPDDAHLAHGAATLLARTAACSEKSRQQVVDLAGSWSRSAAPLARRIGDEVAWLLER